MHTASLAPEAPTHPLCPSPLAPIVRKRLNWQMYAGGISAPDGKNSYSALVPADGLEGAAIPCYYLDPIADSRGHLRGYMLKRWGGGGIAGTWTYAPCGLFRRVDSAMKYAELDAGWGFRAWAYIN